MMRFVLMLVAVLGLTWAGASPSQADTRTVTDRVNDAPAEFDVTQVRYSNRSDRIRIRIDLHRAMNGTRIMVDFNQSFMGRQKFSVDTVRNLDGGIIRNLYIGRDGIPQHPIRCPGLKARWQMALNRVVLQFPQLCLGEGGYGDQRFWVTTGTFHELYDTVGRTRVNYR